MTFHARLTELLEMEKQGVIGKRDVGKFLVNHAEAIRDLVVAAKPLAHYSRMRDAKPMNGMDDAIHSIHVGTEWEAEVTQSQLRGLSEALAKLEEA